MNAPLAFNGNPQLVRPRGESLADLLERVLDKGVVVAGDIVVNILDLELLTLKVRLLICSADTAERMGIDWWRNDPFLNSQAANLARENEELRSRLERAEGRRIDAGPARGQGGRRGG